MRPQWRGILPVQSAARKRQEKETEREADRGEERNKYTISCPAISRGDSSPSPLSAVGFASLSPAALYASSSPANSMATSPLQGGVYAPSFLVGSLSTSRRDGVGQEIKGTREIQRDRDRERGTCKLREAGEVMQTANCLQETCVMICGPQPGLRDTEGIAASHRSQRRASCSNTRGN